MQQIDIFLASSGELKKQRKQIEVFIARENDTLTKQNVYLKLILWEKESKSIHRERIQNKFNDLLLNSDIVIVLFFSKAGQFTLEEYQLAYDNLKNGKKPFFMFVCFDMNDIPQHNIIPSHIEKIHQIKQRLQHDEQLIIEYHSVADLLLQLKMELDNAIPQLKQHLQKSPVCRTSRKTIVDKYLFCNREQQVDEFRQAFENAYSPDVCLPQYYIIHGHEKHSHDSLVKRLLLEARHISETNHWQHEVFSSNCYSVKWPIMTPFQTRQNSITYTIKTEIIPKCRAFEKPQAIFIRHHINALDWDKIHGQLLQWYLQSCWNGLSDNHLFIVFFEIYYEPFFSQIMTGYPCFRIKRTIKKLIQNTNQHCKILLQLPPIRYGFILQWLQSDLNFDRDQSNKISQQYKFSKYRKYAMAHIIDKLEEIELQFYQKNQ